MNINELLNSLSKVNNKVNSSLFSSSLSLQLQELSQKTTLSLSAQTMAAFMPMSEVFKSYQFNGLLESQKKMMNSLSAFSSISSILQQIAAPKIPDSTVIALQGITSLQSIQYFETLKSIQNATSVSKLINPTLEMQKIGNINIAFNSLTARLTQLASNNNEWEILEDYQSFVSEALEFSDNIIENTEEQLETFNLLFDKFTFYYDKHKQSGAIILKFFEILMMFTAMHQYYDFIQTKPEMATKKDVIELKQVQQKTLEYVKKIESHREKNIEEQKLIHTSKVLLKPNKRASIINELPKNYFVEVWKKQPTWILIKYIDPKDGVPQMGWILRDNIEF